MTDNKRLSDYIYFLTGERPGFSKPDSVSLSKLPLLILNSFEIQVIEFQGAEMFLAIQKNPVITTDSMIRQINRIEEILDLPVLLLPASLHSSARRKLIAARINFVLPGSQLSLPDLAMYLSERFKKRKQAEAELKLLPSSQLVIIYSILRKDFKPEVYSLKELAGFFGYSAMAFSKCSDNLEKLGLADIYGGKEKRIKFKAAGRKLWELSRKHFRSPVKRVFYCDLINRNLPLFKSGESALSHYSDLAGRIDETYAISAAEFRKTNNESDFTNYDLTEGKYRIEIWNYNPAITAVKVGKTDLCDPLSLVLTLDRIEDERLIHACNNVLEDYLW